MNKSEESVNIEDTEKQAKKSNTSSSKKSSTTKTTKQRTSVKTKSKTDTKTYVRKLLTHPTPIYSSKSLKSEVLGITSGLCIIYDKSGNWMHVGVGVPEKGSVKGYIYIPTCGLCSY